MTCYEFTGTPQFALHHRLDLVVFRINFFLRLDCLDDTLRFYGGYNSNFIGGEFGLVVFCRNSSIAWDLPFSLYLNTSNLKHYTFLCKYTKEQLTLLLSQTHLLNSIPLQISRETLTQTL